jgi:hypothetical protein
MLRNAGEDFQRYRRLVKGLQISLHAILLDFGELHGSFPGDSHKKPKSRIWISYELCTSARTKQKISKHIIPESCSKIIYPILTLRARPMATGSQPTSDTCHGICHGAGQWASMRTKGLDCCCRLIGGKFCGICRDHPKTGENTQLCCELQHTVIRRIEVIISMNNIWHTCPEYFIDALRKCSIFGGHEEAEFERPDSLPHCRLWDVNFLCGIHSISPASAVVPWCRDNVRCIVATMSGDMNIFIYYNKYVCTMQHASTSSSRDK